MNPYAEALKAEADRRDLKNRRVTSEPSNDATFWDQWAAAEDQCPARGTGLSHYAPYPNKQRRATCFHCNRAVFHRPPDGSFRNSGETDSEG